MSETTVLMVTKEDRRPKVGLLGIGLAAYWPQFLGLRERIESYYTKVTHRLERWGEVIFPGLVDTEGKSEAAGEVFRQKGIDLLLICPGTYGTSSLVMPAIDGQDVPIMLLNLSPERSLDYAHVSTADFLANVGVCCIPEIAGVLSRSGKRFVTVTSHVDDDRGFDGIGEWIETAGVVGRLRRSVVGMVGHVYPGMLDLNVDTTAIQTQLGVRVESIEPDEVTTAVGQVTDEAVHRVMEETREVFEIIGATDEVLVYAARVACGFDRVVDERGLDALTAYWRGEGETQRVGAVSALAFARLSGRGISVSGEGDIRTAIVLKIVHLLGGGGTFAEFYAIDFDGGFIVMGHDGPSNPGLAEGRPILRGLDVLHGKAGSGVGTEFRVKFGPVTMVNLTSTREGRLKMIVAAGESIPGAILAIGNPNSRIRFGRPVAEFFDLWCNEGPSHHVALGVGDLRGKLRKTARVMGIEYVEV
jgi:L-arabinose isomerase